MPSIWPARSALMAASRAAAGLVCAHVADVTNASAKTVFIRLLCDIVQRGRSWLVIKCGGTRTMKRFIGGTILGIGLSAGLMFAQPERFHPRLFRAMEALRDARAYLKEAPHDFGGHREAALRATD